MKKRITSRPGLFGTTRHYDESGRLVGTSRPGLFGTTNHYDADGRHAASSRPGLFSETVTHDTRNNRYISSTPGLFGTNHRSNGRKIGETRKGLFSSFFTTIDD